MTSYRVRVNDRIAFLRRLHFIAHQTNRRAGFSPRDGARVHEQLMRACPSYTYWEDLRTDLRLPRSWLDLVNMGLRRVRRVLVKVMDDQGSVAYHVEHWFAFLDRVHRQGRCDICRHPDTRAMREG